MKRGASMNAGAPVGAGLQRELGRMIAARRIQSAVLLVERGDGSFRWSGAAGRARPDGVAMTAETPFHIASIDKLCTATLALQLVEQGLLDLDAPMVQYLPAALTDGLHRRRGVDCTNRICVRHLAGHMSGLGDYFGDTPPGGVSFADRLVAGADADWTTADLLAIVRDRLTPHFPPQSVALARPRVRYSDTNYLLLNTLIEAVAGQPLEALCHKRIFEPAGLRHTWYWGRSVPAEPAPAPASIWSGDTALDRPRAFRSLQSVYSTAGDLVRLLRALVDGRLFERTDSLALMQQWRTFGLPRDMPSLRLPGWPIQYGLGLMRFRLPRLLTPMRRVPAVIGHTGSTGTWVFHCSERDLYVAGAVNEVASGAVPFRLVPRVLRLFGAAQ